MTTQLTDKRKAELEIFCTSAQRAYDAAQMIERVANQGGGAYGGGVVRTAAGQQAQAEVEYLKDRAAQLGKAA